MAFFVIPSQPCSAMVSAPCQQSVHQGAAGPLPWMLQHHQSAAMQRTRQGGSRNSPLPWMPQQHPPSEGVVAVVGLRQVAAAHGGDCTLLRLHTADQGRWHRRVTAPFTAGGSPLRRQSVEIASHAHDSLRITHKKSEWPGHSHWSISRTG